jgi:hypothetical protein
MYASLAALALLLSGVIAQTTSPDGTCGGTNGYNCIGHPWGNCCSQLGFCGNTPAHCAGGCQLAFGACVDGFENISQDGKCGANGKTCKGSAYGDCCSQHNFCGRGETFCGPGCQSDFSGACLDVPGNVSTDGVCGTNGKTCQGSNFGDCCSASNFCGRTEAHCGPGCQTEFGTCDGAGDISIGGECGVINGKTWTCNGSRFGNCCSSSGFCGQTMDYCGEGWYVFLAMIS